MRQFGKLGIDDQRSGFPMPQHEQDRSNIEPRIQCVEHRPRHRHAEVGFNHRRNVGQQHRDGVAAPYAGPLQGAGEAPGPLVSLAPRTANRAVDDRQTVAVDFSCACYEIDRRERNIVGLTAAQAFVEHMRHRIVSSGARGSHSFPASYAQVG